MWIPVDAETEKPLTWPKSAWPILVHGSPKSGASFFCVTLVADLIRRGESVVNMSSAGAPIKSLQHELALQAPSVKYQTVNSTAATQLKDLQLVALRQTKGKDLTVEVRALNDWRQRIMVITNVEKTMTESLWRTVESHRALIVSGDVNINPTVIPEETFSSLIAFSPLPGSWKRQRSALPAYIGDAWVGKKRLRVIVREK